MTRAHWTIMALLVAATPGSPAAAGGGEDAAKRARSVLRESPLVDGHNDAPWQVRERGKGRLDAVPLGQDTTTLDPPMDTDLPRLREGMVGGQFWSVYVPTSLAGPEAVRATLEQIDVVHRMVARHPEHLALARTADDVERIFADGRIASLMGIEGGHCIGGSPGALRMMYEAGARYTTLTHWRTTDWADAATDAPRHEGLSDFGEDLVREMNRLGMLVDLSHVSAETMRDAIRVSEAPVIFSHSGARAVNPHPRNVPDDVLRAVGRHGGVVMIDFFPAYVSQEVWRWEAAESAEEARLEVLHPGDPDAVEGGLARWREDHPRPKATLKQVVDHIEHVRDLAGVDALGIGGDFDGMAHAPEGLEDVSTYPALLTALARRDWSDEDLAKLAGRNILRVMREAEAVAERLREEREPLVRPVLQ
ncbi:MAG: dipeptidase [Myxococcota bacterium]